jgi:hypothetical protein
MMMQPMLVGIKGLRASPSSSMSWSFRALSCLGRFSVMTPTFSPSVRTSMVS